MPEMPGEYQLSDRGYPFPEFRTGEKSDRLSDFSIQLPVAIAQRLEDRARQRGIAPEVLLAEFLEKRLN